MVQWKKVKDYPNYSVSEDGQVRNDVTENIMSQSLVGGYPMIGLRNQEGRKMLYVHRLVATAFLSNPENYPECNHINAIKQDNRVENLEWCTREWNMRHAWDNGLMRAHRGASAWNSKITEEQVLQIRELRSQGLTLMKLKDMFNIGLTAVYNIVKRKTWSHI